MLNYQSPKPENDFLMLEKDAIRYLSANALYLYVILRDLRANESNSKKALIKKTGLKEWAYKKAKAELVSKGYLATKQLFGNRYAFYIGQVRVILHKKSLKK